MTAPARAKVLARDPVGLVGRTAEVERLLAHAEGAGGLAVLAAPGAGLTGVLRHVFDRLFLEQENVIPFYFEFRASDGDARSAARRSLREFLLQTVAFRRRDASIIDAAPDIREITELAPPGDGHWIDRLVETGDTSSNLSDDRSAIRSFLSAPLRAAAHGARSVVILDAVHITNTLAGGDVLIEEINDIYGRASVPVVVGGLRRWLYPRTSFPVLRLEPCGFEEAGRLVEHLSAASGVAINDQTRDLIAVQAAGNTEHIASLVSAAADRMQPLDSFAVVEAVYTDEVCGGRIAKRYDAWLASGGTDTVRVLAETLESSAGVPVTYWRKHTGLDDAGLERLHDLEVIDMTSGSVTVDRANTVLADYIRVRTRLEIERAARAKVVGAALAENIARAPQLMARHYRGNAAIDLKTLLAAFNGQPASPALIDHGRFKVEFKGVEDEKVLKAAREDKEKPALPQIVYTAHTGAFYPQLDEVCDRERSVVGLGFAGPAEKENIAWLAVEIDSKLEASRETADFWCDRMEMVAAHCGLDNYRIWLIAPEGFTDDALAAMGRRRAYGSSRRQAALLSAFLNAGTAAEPSPAASEYEITVPMGPDTEMIAAHTVEDIARKHNFPAKAINQIKTALVEACINASEHSLSPDRKIHQRFVVTGDKIVITVSNRGLRLADKKLKEVDPQEGRRGWGLKLMRSLMDDVRIEETDDGTRITMTRSISAA